MDSAKILQTVGGAQSSRRDVSEKVNRSLAVITTEKAKALKDLKKATKDLEAFATKLKATEAKLEKTEIALSFAKDKLMQAGINQEKLDSARDAEHAETKEWFEEEISRINKNLKTTENDLRLERVAGTKLQK